MIFGKTKLEGGGQVGGGIWKERKEKSSRSRRHRKVKVAKLREGKEEKETIRLELLIIF